MDHFDIPQVTTACNTGRLCFADYFVRARNMAAPLPTLSIVTLSFNQAKYLPSCLESVIMQKRPGIEYIVVDPGSRDSSRLILHGSSASIDTMILEPDDGPADGLNKGFFAATGDIFGYINADDRLAPGALEFVRKYFALHPDVDVLCGTIRIIDERNRISLRTRTPDRFDPRRYAAGVCTVGQQATFFRRTAFRRARGFRVSNRIAWDGELLLDLYLSGARFDTVRKILGDFRVYRGTISNSGAYRQKYEEYRATVVEKLRRHGIAPLPHASQRIACLAYRINPVRHLSYLLAHLA